MPELFLTSRLLPARHGFSVRTGGVSASPYASLNFGFSVGDSRGHVEENFRRLAHQAGIIPSAFVTASQVHGAEVVEANASPMGEVPRAPIAEADALWTETPGVAVAVKTADCVPILIADPERGRVAAVHSGWRGAEARVAGRAVETLASRGSDPASLLVAIGPAIRVCCYEVSDDLADRFVRGFGHEVVSRSHPLPHLDLQLTVRKTLEAAGVKPERIDVLAHCTSCDAARFYSHRRDRGTTGRHLSFVVGGAPSHMSLSRPANS